MYSVYLYTEFRSMDGCISFLYEEVQYRTGMAYRKTEQRSVMFTFIINQKCIKPEIKSDRDIPLVRKRDH